MSLAVLLWVFIIPALCGILFTYLVYQTMDGVPLNVAVGIGFFALIPTVGYLTIFAYFGILISGSKQDDFRNDTLIGKYFYDSYK